jgi:CHAT domain-containing protein
VQLAALACVLLGLAAAASDPLAFGAALDEFIRPGEVRQAVVQATSGTAMHLRLDHPHLELGLRVLGPGGKPLGEVQNVLKRTDPLTLTVVVEDSGPHRLQVWLRPHAHGGHYRLSLGAASPATDGDQLRLEAQQLRARADALAAAHDAVGFPEALEAYDHAAALWVQTGDHVQRAEMLTRKGNLLEWMGRLPDARSALEEALALWRAVGDRAREADCQASLGLVTSELGSPRAAVPLLEQALAMQRAVRPMPAAEADTLNLLGVVLGNLGDIPGAVEHYTEALARAREDGDPELVALVLKNRATDLDRLGDPERALVDLGEARDAFRAVGSWSGEAYAEYSMGIALDRLRRTTDAWRAFQRALPLLERAGDQRFVGFTLNHLGLLRLETGRPDEARDLIQQALDHLQAAGDQRSSVHMRVNLARTLVASGRAAEALSPLAAARADLHAIGDRTHEAICLTELARAELATGLLLEARQHVLEALRLTEELRGSLAGPSARAAYAALMHDRYELLTGVLMALHAREPAAGWDAAALEASESARARALLEVLAAARVDIARDVDPALRKQERELEDHTERARRTLIEVLGRQHRPEEADAVERELEGLRAERERLEEKMRANSARYAALAPARPLSVDEIRSELLDPTVALVEYLLGERESFVWVVTRTGLRSAVLPGRRRIERAVTALHRRWSDPDAVDDGGALARELSRIVLGPIAGALGPRTLLVVADGALQQIPFAALPVPGQARLLIDSHTVVSSPSASVLTALGPSIRADGRGPELAILADPAFGPDVERRSTMASPSLLRSMEDTGLRALEPLRWTRREAGSIAALLPPDQVIRALGPEASREIAMGPEVARARIVHFATHALLDVKRPELSGIVLAERDQDGRPRPGLLTLADISTMRLSAELVVLSACRTALGKEVRGEGLVGLTRGFMDAGARRVVASLWAVPDAPTAALMSRFYSSMLDQGLSPAEALRGAQLQLRKERRFSAPEAWAGFVLEGDWRPLSLAGTARSR